jgi:hypothetical protein
MVNSSNSFDIKQEYENEENDSKDSMYKIKKVINEANKEEYIEI